MNIAMLQIYCSPAFKQERRYILHVVFDYFWGIQYEIIWESRRNILFKNNGQECLEMDDSFFQQAQEHYLTAASLPQQPLVHWNLKSFPMKRLAIVPSLPIIYGHSLPNGNYYMHQDRKFILGLDVLGSAFFMLTGYEECVKLSRDVHDRFLSINALAFQEGYLERPIINEYLAIFWEILQQAGLVTYRKKRTYRLIPTHDVDAPFDLYLQPKQRVQTLLNEPMPDGMSREERLHVLQEVKHGNWQADPSYSFNKLMEMSECHGLRSRFYFMNAKDKAPEDGNFDADATVVLETMHKIYIHGHEVGLHASYGSYQDAEEILEEAEHLQHMFQVAHIDQAKLGMRVHYLRWSFPQSWQYAVNAGISYDSTLGFADRGGFRCGICYEYPVFNLFTRQALPLIEQPLIVMDRSLLCAKYMGLKEEEALSYMKMLSGRCRRYCGDFILLWHTHLLRDPLYQAIYEKFLAAYKS